ncbi:MAG: dihydrolipoyl dehydrogenase [Pseudomonadota bacterium]
MSNKSVDVAIIGAGPGGYVAAIRASQLGLKVAVIEGNHLGGICLNWGCIPTKALLRTAEIKSVFAHAENFGLKVSGDIEVDFAKVIERSRAVSQQLSKGVQHLLKKNKVEVVDGFGKFIDKEQGKHKLAVEKGGKSVEAVVAANVIIATGARARSLPGIEPDGENIWTYKEAMVPQAQPKSLLVIGSGAIGIEFASFYNALGTDVTVVEVVDRILPVEDAEISALARKSFEAKGIKIHTSAKVTGVKADKDGVVAQIEPATGKAVDLKVDKVLLAVGIQANTENLGLEHTKVKLEKGNIATNPWCQTEEPGVYAIGDVAGAPWLAHKASHEGVLAVEKIAGLKGIHPMKRANIPGCTYSSPQVASIGLTEEAAKAEGREIKVGRFPFMANGKALAMGEPEGLVKTIFDAKTGELLGAHMIGAEVTELIQGFAIAKSLEATEQDLMHTIFPHPTLSEMMHESVLDAFGQVIHM